MQILLRWWPATSVRSADVYHKRRQTESSARYDLQLVQIERLKVLILHT